jgi:hypothetical protein
MRKRFHRASVAGKGCLGDPRESPDRIFSHIVWNNMTKACPPDHRFEFSIDERADDAGGGWQLTLIENGRCVATGLYPDDGEIGYSEILQYAQNWLRERRADFGRG